MLFVRFESNFYVKHSKKLYYLLKKLKLSTNVLLANVPTSKAFTKIEDFFTALANNEISVADYCEYWKIDKENKSIILANK